MVYIISHQGNISKDLFDAITSRAMADNPHIVHCTGSSNVVSMVYPYKGNDKVMGSIYQNVAEQMGYRFKRHGQRRPLLSGPVELGTRWYGSYREVSCFISKILTIQLKPFGEWYP
jgi:hypothetical protein